MDWRIGLRLLGALGLAATLGACALSPREPFTAADQATANLPAATPLRVWGDLPPREIAHAVLNSDLRPTTGHDIDYLALSGGGAGGAFTAGVLKGWTAAGTRPVFDVVSGVSTGALIAPFAFLGPAYDPIVERLYAGGEAATLFKAQTVFGLVAGQGLLDPAPLRRMVDTYATADLMARIAAEHRRGRRLLVLTTNLDAQRPVVWNMGAIAASGRPDALALFRQVLVASASIPVVYPPQMIAAVSAGRTVKEMHVDGAASAEVFVVPDMLAAASRRLPPALRRRIHLWVVVNNTLQPEFALTDPSPLPVAARALATVMKSQTTGILQASFEAARRLDLDFNLAFIDRAVPYRPEAPFDGAYMGAVFGLGRAEAQAGTLWRKSLDDLSRVALR